jgi:hypothetical protein
MSYNTITTLRIISGTMFMLIRNLAWRCTLNQSYREFYREQKSQYGHLMKMARTTSKVAHNSVEVAVLGLSCFG